MSICFNKTEIILGDRESCNMISQDSQKNEKKFCQQSCLLCYASNFDFTLHSMLQNPSKIHMDFLYGFECIWTLADD